MFSAIVKETWSRLREAFARRHIAGVASTSEFDRAFQLERARTDRGGRPFSLVVFLPATERPDDPLPLVRVLRNRTRSTDIIGRLDRDRTGVLLPETPSAGAWTFAEDVLAALARSQLAFDCEVFTYPADWPQHDVGPRTGDRRGVASAVDNGLGRLASVGTLVEPAPAMMNASHLQLVRDVPASDGLAHVRASLGHRQVADMSTLFVRRLPIWKRGMDILVSSTLLVLLSPLMLAVAVAIKLSSPGPIVFRQLRAGLGGRPFTFLKFRSMYIDAEERRKALEGLNEASGPVFKMKNDPRVTRVGRLIRGLSIDEIPQLWNVLRGDMTLVGPRPPILDEVERYESWQRHRLDTTGGLTCIWQVSGRSNIAFIDWMRMDRRYIAKRSLLFDLRLLVMTANAVLSRRGAY